MLSRNDRLNKRNILSSSIQIWILVVFLFGLELVRTEAYEYAAGKALGGADATRTRGIFCVGINPANLGLPTPYRYSFLIGGINYQLTNNFFNLATGQVYSGQDLTVADGRLQQRFLGDLPEEGWRLTWVGDIGLPLLNLSIGNQAFTTRVISSADFYVSRPVLDVIFGGLQKGQRYELDLRCDAFTAVEYGFTMAIPYDRMAVGITLKYLHGLGYYGLDPQQTQGYLLVDTANFLVHGGGDFYFRESYAGRGFGIDVGLAFTDLDGWDLGLSLLNLGELIQWNAETVLSKVFQDFWLVGMGKQIKTWPFRNSDLKLDFKGKSFRYTFQIDSLNGHQLFRSDSAYGDYFHSRRTTLNDTNRFSVRVPAVLRISAARDFGKKISTGIDLTASFDDRFYFHKGWRVGLGCEYRYFPKLPLRVGLVLGGLAGWEFNIGSGYRIGPVVLDYAIGFNRGFWLHTLKGINFALGAYFTAKGSSK
jgi:hypothetical protein